MAGTFEVYESKNGEYRWRLKAGNGEVTAVASEGYTTKAAAKKGIESVQRDAAAARVEEV